MHHLSVEMLNQEVWKGPSSAISLRQRSLLLPQRFGVPLVPTFLQQCPWETLAWKLVLDAPHPLMFSQDLADPCTSPGQKLPSRNVAGLLAGIVFRRNKHLGHASLVLEESLFVSAALERLFQNSSSMRKVTPVIRPRLGSSGRSAGTSGCFIHPIFPRYWRSERSGCVICLSEPVLLPCLV